MKPLFECEKGQRPFHIVMVGLDPTIPSGTKPRIRAVGDPRVKPEDDDLWTYVPLI